MKYLGVGALSGAVMLVAVYMDIRRKRHAKMLLKLADFFAAFSDFSAMTPSEAAKTVNRLTGNGDYGALGFLMTFASRCKDANVKQVWREEVASFDGYSLFTSDEKELLLSFADSFGLTSLEVFTDSCKKYSENFAKRHERLQNDIDKNGKLTLCAGVLSAALIFIVLI